MIDIDCPSLEDFTPQVKSHMAYMDFCTDMVLRPVDLGTAKAEASRAGTLSLTPDYNISVPRQCTSTARPRTGAEPPSGEESLRQVSQLTLNLLCPNSFSPEQRPADLTTTAVEAPPPLVHRRKVHKAIPASPSRAPAQLDVATNTPYQAPPLATLTSNLFRFQ